MRNEVFTFFCLLVFPSCSVEYARSPVYYQSHPVEFQSSDIATSPTLLSTALEFGQAATSFEPPQPVGLAGFGGAPRRILLPHFDQVGGDFSYFLPYTKVDLPPRVKVSLWSGKTAEGSGGNYALISLDLVAVTADITKKLSETLSKEFPDLKLSTKNIDIVASHTHAGPGGLSDHPFWGGVASDHFNPSFFKFFTAQVVAAFKQAVTSRKPLGVMSIAESTLTGFNKSRMKGIDADKTQLHVRLTSDSNESIGCFQIFAVHPTHYGLTERVLSSDISGHIEKAFEDKDDINTCAFLNGVVGNAEADTGGNLDEYSKRFVESVTSSVASLTPRTGSTLLYDSQLLELPAPQFNETACSAKGLTNFVDPDILEALPNKSKLSYLYFGKTLFLFLPGEPNSTVANQITVEIKKQFSEIERVQILSTANDYLGYFVGPNEYLKPGLEECSSIYTKHMADILTNKIMKLLERSQLK